ncbi:MAG TPA: hypothetical protein VEA40_10960 [Ramlibacter sp.]|nr:hypothetical protein [Ramlibacter sp.]
MSFLRAVLLACLAVGPAAAVADDDGDRKRRGGGSKHEEKFVSGPCKVERKWGRDGEFKEKQECRGVAVAGITREHEEKFQDGPCKVERVWKKDGEFKQEVECKGSRGVPVAVVPQPAVVLPQPPSPAPHAAPRERQCRPVTYERQLPDGRWTTVREMECR